MRLLEKLGLKDIFQPKPLKEQSKQLQVASLVQFSEPNTLDLRGSVEDKSIKNDRSERTENDRRKERLKSETTKARRHLKRGVLINEITQATHAKETQNSVREEDCCQVAIG